MSDELSGLQPGDVETALRALVTRLEMVHADPKYGSVWMINQIHMGPYTGPTYTAEFEAAKELLARIDAARGDGAPL